MPFYKKVLSEQPNSAISEQYRRIRTNIDFSNFNKGLKVINLTSSSPQEGKTMTVVNLALAYAESKVKTLLIDLDLRKPKIHRAFNIPNETGLLDHILNGTPIKNNLVRINENLDILIMGDKVPYPVELLISTKLKDLIEELKNIYDHIIIDCPPITAASDAQIISNLADGTVFVIASRKTKKEVANRCIKELKDNGSNIIGGVLTRVARRDQEHGMETYYYGE